MDVHLPDRPSMSATSGINRAKMANASSAMVTIVDSASAMRPNTRRRSGSWGSRGATAKGMRIRPRLPSSALA